MGIEIKEKGDVTRIAQEIKTADGRITEILDQAGDSELSPELKSELSRLEGDSAEKSAALEEWMEKNGQKESARNAVQNRKAMLQTSINALKFAPSDGANGNIYKATKGELDILNAAYKSVGEAFIESDSYKSLLRGHSIGDDRERRFSAHKLPDMDPVEFGAAIDSMSAFKALFTGASATSAGALVQPMQYGAMVELPRRELTIRDLVTEVRTTSDTIEYTRFTARTNNAAPVAEATADTGSSGTKPQSTFTLARATAPIVTIAHYYAATRRALADAPQIRDLIDQDGRDGIEEELEDQIINGDGTGENFEGIATVSGTTAQAFVTDIKTTLRKARTKVKTVARIRNRARVAVLMNPDDVESLDLDQDNEARYYMGGPRVVLTPMIWGMPIIETEAVPAGTAYVADFRDIVLFNREQTVVRTTDSHSDWFIRNLIAILFEGRWGLAVRRPAAIIVADLAA